MASQLQNRIVGSVILIALAVIILPELFDGKPQQQQETFETIPLQPDIEVAEQAVQQVPESELPRTLANVETLEIDAEQAPQLDADATPSKSQPRAPSQTALTEPGWVIQLGVFSNQASVERLLKQLQAAGYPAYAEQIQTRNGPANKMLVKPSLVKSELEQDLPALKKLTQLNGQLK